MGVDQAGEKLERKWIKLMRNSRSRLDQARENPWIKLVRNDRDASIATRDFPRQSQKTISPSVRNLHGIRSKSVVSASVSGFSGLQCPS